METRLNQVGMYWWEGYFGLRNILRRVIKGQKPYVSNFGDLLSPFIVSLLTGKKVYHTNAQGKLLALGSIFFALKNKDHVWGSGFLNAKHICYARTSRENTYHAVRGPETRRLLVKNHIECPEVYGDPAMLLPYLIKNDIPKKYLVGIVPHFSHFQHIYQTIKNDHLKVIDVEESLCDVIRHILSCEIVLSTSLHGLIVAEAYGIPALLLMLDTPLHGDLFKYEDYFHATNRTLSFAKFDNKKLSSLIDLAIKQARSTFNPTPLLEAFPLKIPSFTVSQWSMVDSVMYKHSITPPKFSVQ